MRMAAIEQVKQYENVYGRLQDLERAVSEEERDGRSRTRCGFEYGAGPCGVCMFRAGCEETVQASRWKVWELRTGIYRNYSKLAENVRTALKEDPASERLRVLLARILRSLARNDMVLGEGRKEMAQESFRLFTDLYYQTGAPVYREEAESARILAAQL